MTIQDELQANLDNAFIPFHIDIELISIDGLKHSPVQSIDCINMLNKKVLWIREQIDGLRKFANHKFFTSSNAYCTKLANLIESKLNTILEG